MALETAAMQNTASNSFWRAIRAPRLMTYPKTRNSNTAAFTVSRVKMPVFPPSIGRRSANGFYTQVDKDFRLAHGHLTRVSDQRTLSNEEFFLAQGHWKWILVQRSDRHGGSTHRFAKSVRSSGASFCLTPTCQTMAADWHLDNTSSFLRLRYFYAPLSIKLKSLDKTDAWHFFTPTKNCWRDRKGDRSEDPVSKGSKPCWHFFTIQDPCTDCKHHVSHRNEN